MERYVPLGVVNSRSVGAQELTKLAGSASASGGMLASAGAGVTDGNWVAIAPMPAAQASEIASSLAFTLPLFHPAPKS